MSGIELGRELRERAEALRDEIDGLLLDLPGSSGPSVEALKSAEAAVSRFCELGSTDDGLAALAEVRDAITRARDALPEDRVETDGPLLEEARTWAEDLRRRALDHLPSVTALQERAARLEIIEPFVASMGSPAVHVPHDVPPPELIDKPKPFLTPPDDEADARRGKKNARSPVETQLARLGRDAMEDVAILGGLRRLKDDEVWTQVRGFEDRLLANLDALWSLDRPVRSSAPRLGVPAALFTYVTEWSFPDWGRAFALALTLGCTSSETALRWVVLAMRRAEPAVIGAYVAGLSAASGPGIGKVALSELGADVNAATTAAWLEIAERKRSFEAGVIVPLLAHPDPGVRIRAARCLRHAPRELAVSALVELLDDASVEVHAEVADELAAFGRPEGLERLRSLMTDAFGSAPPNGEPEGPVALIALRALALAGDPGDEARVLAASLRLRLGPEWLGWYGRPPHVEVLLGELERARDAGPEGHARALACEGALRRITGLEAGSSVALLRAEIADMTEASPAYRDARRARLGEPFTVTRIVDELRDPMTLQGVRRTLSRELALHTPLAPRLDIEDWGARQDASLALL